MSDAPRGKSQEDRDLASDKARKERERRDQDAFGVPVHVHTREDVTPVAVVLELIEGSDLAPETKARLAAHTANAHLRAHEASKRTDLERIASALDAAETAITDIRGEHGNNGKLGALRERVDKAEARKWWLVTFIATTLVAVIGSAIVAGRWIGAIETDVAQLKARQMHHDKDRP